MNDLNKKPVEELRKLEEESRAELFALRFQLAIGNLEKSHCIGKLKKQIARVLTILSIRKNIGKNTTINIKTNLSEIYAKIEKESQFFAKQRKAKIKQIMIKQQAVENQMTNLMNLPLNNDINLMQEKPAVAAKTKVTKPVVEKKPATTKMASLTIKKKTTANKGA